MTINVKQQTINLTIRAIIVVQKEALDFLILEMANLIELVIIMIDAMQKKWGNPHVISSSILI